MTSKPNARVGFIILIMYLYACLNEHVVCGDTVEITGIGASLPSKVYREWIFRYQIVQSLLLNPIKIKYASANSIVGKQVMKKNVKAANETNHVFAGSNSDLSDKEYLDDPQLTIFPVMSGAVVIVYNLADIQLILRLDQLVKIFSSRISKWNDPELVKNNPQLAGHNAAIKMIARQDSSDSTKILTSVLSDSSEEWRKTRGVFVTGQQDSKTKIKAMGWPSEAIYMYGKGTAGVLGFVSSVPYTIGYASFSGAKTVNLQIAEIYNKRGVLIATTKISESVKSATDYAMKTFGNRLVSSLTNAPTVDGYPFATYTYIIVNKTTSPGISCAKMIEFLKFVNWFLEDELARQIAVDYSMVPLSLNMVSKVREKVLKRLSCENKNVWESMDEEQAGRLGAIRRNKNLVIVQTTMLIVFFVCIIIACSVLQKFRLNKAANAKDWLWDEADVKMFVKSSVSVGSRNTLEAQADNMLQKISRRQKFGSSQDQSYVLFDATFKRLPDNFSLKSNRVVNEMINKINHEGIMKLSGIMLVSAGLRSYYVFQGQEVNWLHFVFKSSRYTVSDEVCLAIAIDACTAMEFLQDKGIVHTTLNSISTFLDSKWSVKIGDWCKKEIYESEGGKINWCSVLASQVNEYLEVMDTDEQEQKIILQYIDPHIFMFVNDTDAACHPMDLYSFGLLLLKMWTKYTPLHQHNSGIQMEEAIRAVLSGRMRPQVPDIVDANIAALIKDLTQPNDDARPTFKITLEVLLSNKINDNSNGIVSTLLRSMEEYMANLELTIDERTYELRAITDKVEMLLETMLPREVAKKLQNGDPIDPEFFNEASIYFSDIIGFTDIASGSSPLQIVNLLNKVYMLFDECIEKFDVYKVETIGDAYMCSSGLPIRNEQLHIAEITKMAIEIVRSVKGFTIPHMPSKTLQIRVGINCGPVMAGVVGLTMPRYCLFGDAVNTASRMESTSKAMRIHASKTIVSSLRIHNPDDFKFTKRGVIEVKSKGQMETFWVHLPNTSVELDEIVPGMSQPVVEEEEIIRLGTDKGFIITEE